MTVSVIIIMEELALKPLKIRQHNGPGRIESCVQEEHVPTAWVQWRLSKGFCENIPVFHIIVFV